MLKQFKKLFLVFLICSFAAPSVVFAELSCSDLENGIANSANSNDLDTANAMLMEYHKRCV